MPKYLKRRQQRELASQSRITLRNALDKSLLVLTNAVEEASKNPISVEDTGSLYKSLIVMIKEHQEVLDNFETKEYDLQRMQFDHYLHMIKESITLIIGIVLSSAGICFITTHTLIGGVMLATGVGVFGIAIKSIILNK